MPSQFYALDIDNGDAFLLVTEHNGSPFSILVDGGKKAKVGGDFPLIEAIERADQQLQHLNVVICTHSDADHANGLKTLAEGWYGKGKTIGEFWLPGRWSSAFPQILSDPYSFVSALLSGANEAAIHIHEALWDSLEESAYQHRGLEHSLYEMSARIEELLRMEGQAVLADTPVLTSHEMMEHLNSIFDSGSTTEEQKKRMLSHALGVQSRVDLDSLGEVIESDGVGVSEILSAISEAGPYIPPIYRGKTRRQSVMMKILIDEVVDTATSIEKIAEAAVRFTIPIRWFDFGEFENTEKARGGLKGLLEPVNAVELVKPLAPPNSLALFYSLRLTKQNVESLVFQRVENDAEPAALFLGDSRLAFGINRPTSSFTPPSSLPSRPFIVTAAHHGSRVNDKAYEVLEEWFNGASIDHLFFVRNGGVWNQKLNRFATLPERRCAQCYQCKGKGWNQLVKLETAGNDWSWSSTGNAMCGTPK